MESFPYQSYPRNYPDINEYVISKILDNQENVDYGLYVELVEYKNKHALIPNNQISKKNRGNNYKYLNAQKYHVLQVIAVNEQKKHIDCSKIRVSTDDEMKCTTRFNENKFIYNLWYNLYLLFKIDIDDFYNKFVYPLIINSSYEDEDVCYYRVNKSISDYFDKEYYKTQKYSLDDHIITSLKEIFYNKTAKKNIIYRLKVSINCYDTDGIDGIKNCINEIQSNFGVKIKYVSSPYYIIEFDSEKKIEDIENVFKQVVSYGNNYLLKNYKYSNFICENDDYQSLKKLSSRDKIDYDECAKVITEKTETFS